MTVEPPIRVEGGSPLPSLAIHLGRTKTLNTWMTAAKIDSGSVFRGIGRWGTVSKRALDPQSVNAMLKQRAEMAGLEPGSFRRMGRGRDT